MEERIDPTEETIHMLVRNGMAKANALARLIGHVACCRRSPLLEALFNLVIDAPPLGVGIFITRA